MTLSEHIKRNYYCFWKYTIPLMFCDRSMTRSIMVLFYLLIVSVLGLFLFSLMNNIGFSLIIAGLCMIPIIIVLTPLMKSIFEVTDEKYENTKNNQYQDVNC